MNLLRRILSSIDTFSVQQIYQTMIMSIFAYGGYIIVLDGQSPAKTWSAPLKNEALKSFPRNAVTRTAIFDF